MSRARLVAVSFAALSAAACPAPAHALVPWQVVAYSGGYVSSEIYVLQGDTLTLHNADHTMQSHDLRSSDTFNGVIPFRSALIATGQSADVVGVATLAPGDYPFTCSVHEFMIGNLHVQAV